MENSSNNFREYYGQFITSETIDFVKNNIGIEKLKASKCEHFNDIIKHSHEGSWVWDFAPFNVKLAKELGECNSLSTHTCIAKEAARRLLAGEYD